MANTTDELKSLMENPTCNMCKETHSENKPDFTVIMNVNDKNKPKYQIVCTECFEKIQEEDEEEDEEE